MKWETAKLSEITHVVTKGTTPTTMGKAFVESGINFIKAESLNGDSNLDHQAFAFIDEDTQQKLKRSILQDEDIFLTIAGAQVGVSLVYAFIDDKDTSGARMASHEGQQIAGEAVKQSAHRHFENRCGTGGFGSSDFFGGPWVMIWPPGNHQRSFTPYAANSESQETRVKSSASA